MERVEKSRSREVGANLALNPLAILESLGLRGPADITPVTGGADMAIWRVEHDGAEYALRLFRAEQAAASQREIAAMRVATAHGLPVPTIRAEGVWQDRPVVLLDWMPGRTLRDELCARPWLAWQLGIDFGRMQARLHQTPAPADLRETATPWIDWAEPDDALRRRLQAVAAEPSALLHLDYHPLNVLVADRQVSAILDWTNARAGDPRLDLARTTAILHLAPIAGCLPTPLSAMARRALTAGWRNGYRSLAGPISGMAPFYAWAGALMVREFTPRLGRSDLPWVTPVFLARVQAWTDDWLALAERSASNAR
jgi:aminoglycoside phosphotransferase (APT) family kinase protein